MSTKNELIEQLVHGNELQRCLAAQAMGFENDEIFLPLLIRELRNTPSRIVRKTIVEALGRYDDDSAIYTLIETSRNNSEPEIRRFAIETLGEQAETSLPYRQSSSRAIENSVDFLLECLQESEPLIIDAALNSLEKIGHDSASSGIYELIVSQPENVKQKAANVLMRFEGEKSLTLIQTGLSAPDSRVRNAFAVAINRYLDSFDSNEQFTKGWLRENRRGYRRGNSSVEVIVNTLIERLKEPVPTIRQAILEALEKIQRILIKIRTERSTSMGGYGDDDDDGGRDYAVEVRPSAAEDRVRKALQEESALQPLKRYADLRLFEDNLRNQVDTYQKLQALQWYQLEIAIREQPIGLPLNREVRRSIEEPQQTEDVTILITAEAEGFDVEQPISKLLLPARGDSKQNAYFRIRPKRECVKGAICLRLFYNFNLLEEVIFQASFIPRFSDIEDFYSVNERRRPSRHRRDEEVPNIFFRQSKLEQEYIDFDDVLPRSMHINVSSRGDDIVFTFTFLNESRQQVEFISIAPFEKSELEDWLVRIRKIWLSISLSEVYTSGLEAGKQEFISIVRKLAEVGHSLWVRLFRLDIDSAIFLVGEWLREHPLPEESLIQVSTDLGISNFSFPWSLLYDRELPDKDYILPDLNGFWGIRYCIEQQIPNHRRATDASKTNQYIKFDYLRWEQFKNINRQNTLIDSLIGNNQGKLIVSQPPIITAKKGYEVLEIGDSNILYFYAHGYTRLRESAQANNKIFDFFARDLCKKVKTERTLKSIYKPLRDLCDLIEKGDYEFKDSWIELSSGRLYLNNLYSKPIRFKFAPFVFLNLCESAQVVPSLSDSFIHFFINRGAKTVIGTECPMTIEFAHPFSEFLLTRILAGESIGNALLKARRHFLTKQSNPLGLAYTLFGTATHRFSLA